mgnify:CR=1 FL=1
MISFSINKCKLYFKKRVFMRIFNSHFCAPKGVLTPSKRSQAAAQRPRSRDQALSPKRSQSSPCVSYFESNDPF